MKDKIFLDTNIFIYAIDSSPLERNKRDTARELIDKTIERGDGATASRWYRNFFRYLPKGLRCRFQ